MKKIKKVKPIKEWTLVELKSIESVLDSGKCSDKEFLAALAKLKEYENACKAMRGNMKKIKKVKQLNLYLVSQDKNEYYDTYGSFIVAAPDAKTARHTYPNDTRVWSKKEDTWCTAVYSYNEKNNKYVEELVPDTFDNWGLPKDVTVKKIGTTNIKKPKVIIASYRAG